jgi:holo-[acyl-carrier protein] synthase
MALKGIGIDIIEIERVKEAVEKHGQSFLAKVFTPRELKYCTNRKAFRYPELAVRFAAKEAYAKALGTGIRGFGRKNKGVGWKDIEIMNGAHGKPFLKIKGRTSRKAHVTLSHSRDYAVASVYVEN